MEDLVTNCARECSERLILNALVLLVMHVNYEAQTDGIDAGMQLAFIAKVPWKAVEVTGRVCSVSTRNPRKLP